MTSEDLFHPGSQEEERGIMGDGAEGEGKRETKKGRKERVSDSGIDFRLLP